MENIEPGVVVPMPVLPLPKTEKMELVELAVAMLKMLAVVPNVVVAEANEAEPVTLRLLPTVKPPANTPSKACKLLSSERLPACRAPASKLCVYSPPVLKMTRPLVESATYA